MTVNIDRTHWDRNYIIKSSRREDAVSFTNKVKQRERLGLKEWSESSVCDRQS